MRRASGSRAPDGVEAWLGSSGRDERPLKWAALGLALTIHVLALSIRLPAPAPAPPPVDHGPAIVIRRYVPPPPRSTAMREVRPKSTRRLPIPDPTPMDPEPILEAAARVPPDVEFEGDVEILLGEAEGPPLSGIALAGTGGVTMPVLIPGTKTEPEYPEAARRARVRGSVILQAVIKKDGTVSDLELLRCDAPNVGFEEAAIAAVRQWRYRPALSQGKPVDAYFTVYVSFDLL